MAAALGGQESVHGRLVAAFSSGHGLVFHREQQERRAEKVVSGMASAAVHVYGAMGAFVHTVQCRKLGGHIAWAAIGRYSGWTAEGVGVALDTELVDATGRSERKPLVDGNHQTGKNTIGYGF